MKSDGPYLNVAVFCTGAGRRAGKLECNGIVSRLTADRPPLGKPTKVYEMLLFVLFNAGAFHGQSTLEVFSLSSPEDPLDGAVTLQFKGGDSFIDGEIRMPMAFYEEETLWWEIRLDGETLTRVSLEVSFRSLHN